MKGVPPDMLDEKALARWAGCSSLGGNDPRLWVTKGTRCGAGASQSFGLGEIVEAGLRAKIIGLNDADLSGVIADCVGDLLEQLRDALSINE